MTQPKNKDNDAQAPKETKTHLTRRDFVRLGAQSAALAPVVGWAIACDPKDPPKETIQEPTPDASQTDKQTQETTPEPIATVDPQDEVKPESYDKGQEKTWNPSGIAQDAALFPLGVMAGAMTETSALLWSFTDDTKPKKLFVWREAKDKDKVVQVAEFDVTPKTGYMHQKVETLAPGTWYEYGFFEGTEKRSIIGRFRTALVEKSKKPLRLAATSCTNFRNAPYTALQLTAKSEYDLFVHLGDMVYNDGAVSQNDFRQRWQRTFKDPGYQAVLPKTGMYITWDDHEISNNTDIPKLPQAQRRAGIEAFFENSVAERVKDDRFWNSYRWGHTAEIFVLDSRGERIPKSDAQPEPQYISPAQMKWFQNALKDSPCHFKIVLNSVPMLDWSKTAISTSLETDRWQGHPKQRSELLGFIENNTIDNVWWISGDFHIGCVARVDPEGYHKNAWEILVGPGGNGPNPAVLLYENADEERKEEMFPAAQFEYIKSAFAATFLTFDPEKDEVTVEFVDDKTKQTAFKKTFKAGTPT